MAKKKTVRRQGGRDPVERAEAQAKFLAAYEQCGVLTRAAIGCGIDRRSHYDWLKMDRAYAERFAESEEVAIEELEAEARTRAIEGKSDTLLIFLLKSARPKKYNRKMIEVTGADGGAQQHAHTLDLSKCSVEELRKLKSIMETAGASE